MRSFVIIAAMVVLTACSDDTTDDTSGPGGGNGGGDCPACDAPTTSDAMFSFLADGSYSGWDAESAAHASTGPHGGSVRVFLSPKLSSSLAADNATHDRGSAVVKELLDSDGMTVTGWAVWVKVADDSDGGDGIYWYENFSTTNNSPVADGLGESGCAGCHSGGTDFLLIPYPLQ